MFQVPGAVAVIFLAVKWVVSDWFKKKNSEIELLKSQIKKNQELENLKRARPILKSNQRIHDKNCKSFKSD